MSNVTITVAGRAYTLACAPGEEEHLAMLGQMIEERIAGQPNIAGQSEVRRLLYAALLLADALHEQEARRPPAPSAGPLEALAERLERTADRLEAEAGEGTGA